MSISSGDLDTFGAAIEDMDLFGASSINPNDMRNNCVSVSIAHFQYYSTVEEFWQTTYGHSLPDKPIRESEAKDMIARCNIEFQWIKYKSDAPGTAYQMFLQNKQTFLEHGGLFMFKNDKNKPGHCINLIPGMGHTPTTYELLDFQRESWGVNREKDVKEALKIVVGYQTKDNRSSKEKQALWTRGSSWVLGRVEESQKRSRNGS